MSSGGISNPAGGTCTLLRTISAIEILPGPKERGRLGHIVQLAPGTRVDICGPGFNDRTVRICSEQHYYFAFREDLTAPQEGEGGMQRRSAAT